MPGRGNDCTPSDQGSLKRKSGRSSPKPMRRPPKPRGPYCTPKWDPPKKRGVLRPERTPQTLLGSSQTVLRLPLKTNFLRHGRGSVVSRMLPRSELDPFRFGKNGPLMQRLAALMRTWNALTNESLLVRERQTWNWTIPPPLESRNDPEHIWTLSRPTGDLSHQRRNLASLSLLCLGWGF